DARADHEPVVHPGRSVAGDAHHVVLVEDGEIAGAVELGADLLEEGLYRARDLRGIAVRPPEPEHARREPVHLPVAVQITQVMQGAKVAPGGGARDAGAPGRGRRGQPRMRVVERLDDAQALLEARDPVAPVERGFLYHASSPKARESRPPSPIIAHKGRVVQVTRAPAGLTMRTACLPRPSSCWA